MDDMIAYKLKNFLSKRRCTLLGVGPMSVNCVDATIELANDHDVPLMLVASRRQIDSEDFNGGYVNNWSTSRFAEYVINSDKKDNILLARDHGGPWQNDKEKENNLSLRRAMNSAKVSYLSDLEAGFQILHIDPSIDIHGRPSVDEVLVRIYELYEYCWTQAQRLGKEVLFEIGTEEQSGSTNTPEELDYTLASMKEFCGKNNMPMPTFVVIQSGSRVMEMRNVGCFDLPIRVAGVLPAEIQVPRMIEICNRYGIMMKAHNTDYMSDEALQWHPRLGIHSVNVAPEFGVEETLSLLSVLEENNLQILADDFLRIAYESNKWVKWMIKDTTATDRDRAIISGHYVFSTPECLEIKAKASSELKAKNIDLEFILKESVKRSIQRYINHLRIVRNA
jgi:tagatose-1,6-bisphosphate aldolase non-catalytic subunit AgaZ/GatZ